MHDVPAPPPRPARLDGLRFHGETGDEAARRLILRLEAFADLFGERRFGARAVRSRGGRDGVLGFEFAGVAGEVRLTLAAGGWVCAEVTLGGRPLARCWAECAYEEIEFWPDGSDGVEVDGDPPGRIGKRGNWMQIDAARWPGLEGMPERWLSIDAVEEG